MKTVSVKLELQGELNKQVSVHRRVVTQKAGALEKALSLEEVWITMT